MVRLKGAGHGRFCWHLQGDMGNRAVLDAVLSRGFDAVMHFASFIQVGESVQQPAKYYQNNVVNTLTLLEAMRSHGWIALSFRLLPPPLASRGNIPLTSGTHSNPSTPMAAPS